MQRPTLIYPSSNSAARDQVGIATALLCAAHCALLPLGAGALSALGLGMLLSEGAELALVMFAAAIGVWSLWPAFQRRHRDRLPLLLFATGILLMVSARGLEDISARVPPLLVIAGAALVATAHVKNLCLCQQCAVCCDDRAEAAVNLTRRSQQIDQATPARAESTHASDSEMSAGYSVSPST